MLISSEQASYESSQNLSRTAPIKKCRKARSDGRHEIQRETRFSEIPVEPRAKTSTLTYIIQSTYSDAISKHPFLSNYLVLQGLQTLLNLVL